MKNVDGEEMGFDAALAVMLASVPWTNLGRAENYGVPDTVPKRITELVRGATPEIREEAAGGLYCAAANQGVLGEVSPFVANILVRVLRQGLCVDRESVYYVIQAIQECRAWRVRDDDVGERILAESRSEIEAGWDAYLVDLHRLDLARSPSLLLLLEDFAAKRLEVLVHLWAEVNRADGDTKAQVMEAYAGALEHALQHTADPGECFCGDGFWLTTAVVNQAAPELVEVRRPPWAPIADLRQG
ncbi:hypothetical protein GCM10009541_14620 [Micromonospora gifhornensis]|uniref:Uncharacterized protein n=1 Tax=Micromonospora gifhornensis TaxID=84594 RepID=A0ABQ4IFE7_9ACTN|nr:MULTISPECIES: hypothetical protein [Micromonospora]GIJ16648.1 hypothetical protein Vgi01_33320 [Micromonospora gifhornensis]